jgi:16S rRNA (guanine527-N7)-methyltransferase
VKPSAAHASSVAERKLTSLLARYSLPPATGLAFGALLELLAADPLAPTTVRDPARAVDEHLADSLVALEFEPVRNATAIADLGSGAGFPGLALALALPAAEVSLVESNARRCGFIERARSACGAANVTVVNARAEAWPDGLGGFDLVTARALAAPAVVAEYAAPLLRIGGALVIWRGRRDPAAERSAEGAAAELGLELFAPVRVKPFEGAERRYLHLMSKVSQTPARFPRRTGMATKRPLGAGESRPARRV